RNPAAGRARLHPRRPAGDDAFGRRGAARQARERAIKARNRPHPLHPRRADHRLAFPRRREIARRPARARRAGQFHGGDRAQSRSDQDRGLDHRSRPGRRGRRRRDRCRRPARGDRQGQAQLHRTVSRTGAGAARAADGGGGVGQNEAPLPVSRDDQTRRNSLRVRSWIFRMTKIRVGVGGWTFAPWRGTFYPKSLPQARELEYASRQLTSIEINGTFYGSQKPASFGRWRDETPDDFVFSVKGPRFATHRRELSGAGESIERFFATGVLELSEKLGPVLWQFPGTKRFDPEDFGAFLKLLPTRIGERKLRHVVEVSHASFAAPAFIELLRRHGVALALVDSADR